MTSQFADITSSPNFFDIAVFLFSSLDTGLRFMSISWLVLEFWLFSFIRNWPEIRKSEIPPSEDWGKLGIRNLAQIYLIKSYWMLQKAKVRAFTRLPPRAPTPPATHISVKLNERRQKPFKAVDFAVSETAIFKNYCRC